MATTAPRTIPLRDPDTGRVHDQHMPLYLQPQEMEPKVALTDLFEQALTGETTT